MTEWEEARRRAFLHEAMGLLARRPVDLLPFEEVRQQLHLRNSRYLGVVDVPLDQIVGSADRYADFIRESLPQFRYLEKRWEWTAPGTVSSCQTGCGRSTTC